MADRDERVGGWVPDGSLSVCAREGVRDKDGVRGEGKILEGGGIIFAIDESSFRMITKAI